MLLPLLLLTVMLIVIGENSARAQRVYADAATASGTTPSVVSNPTYAQGASTSLPPTSTLPAKLFAKGSNGGALSPGTAQSGYLELRFTGGTSTSNVFLKIANTSISGSGSNISYALYNTSTLVTSNTSSITAADGSTLIVIAGSSAFDRIRITATGGGGSILGGAGGTASVDVYYGFFNKNNINDCGQGLGTSGSGTLGGSVNNLINAIDGDLVSKSTLALGILLSSAEQTFYFSGASTTSDALKFTVSVPPAILSASVLNNITVTAYNGPSNTSVWSTGLGTLLALDLLNLLNTGAPITTSVAPNVLFDRVTINFSAAVSVLSELHIHEIERVPPIPILAPPASQNTTICAGSQATLMANTPASGYEIRWYSAATGGTLLHTGNPFNPSPSSTTIYYLASGKIGCSTESERIATTVTVNATPTVSIITGTPTICVGQTTTLTTITTGGTWSSSDPLIAAVNTSGLVTGVASGTANIIYTVTNGTCTASTSRSLTVNALPVVGSITGPGVVCVSQSILLSSSTSGGSWASSNSAVATVNSTGQVDGITTGTVVISYLINNGTCSATVTKSIVVNALPTITLGAIPIACIGHAFATLPYTATTGSPISYSIIWSSPALSAGFLPINNGILNSAKIDVILPATATVNTYSGTLTVKNSIGCISSSISFSIEVHNKLPAPPITIISNN